MIKLIIINLRGGGDGVAEDRMPRAWQKTKLTLRELCLTRNCGDFCSELRKMFLIKMKEETLALLAAKTRNTYHIVMAYN